MRRSAKPAPDPAAVYQVLYTRYGPQHWWPGDSPFEVMVGAVLTQNTAWSNVERAIANLNQAGSLAPEAILEMPAARLAALLRPSGHFNVKARRLRNFCAWYLEAGGHAELKGLATDPLRAGLLSVNGIGPETADDILLYAFDRPVFVIDAYTRRLFERLGHAGARTLAYERLRRFFEQALPADVALLNEYHALIVRHAKLVCRPRPVCAGCCLATQCRLFLANGTV